MHDAERRIAVDDIVHQNPDREDVVDLFEGFILLQHFLVNAEQVLLPPGNLRAKVLPGKPARNLLFLIRNEGFAFGIV